MYCKNMKLMRSASEENTYFTYVCLINDIKPSVLGSEAHKRLSLHLPDAENDEVCEEEDHIRIERSKALHELVESHRKNEDEIPPQKYNDIITPLGTPSETPYATTSGEDFNNVSEVDDSERDGFSENPNPNILKLTKMKWLTEENENAPDSSSPSLSPASSLTSSQCSNESETIISHHLSFNDKYLSTIIRLDKEHNMFGLSNIAIVGSRASKRLKKDDDKAVFHQTAIVQVCCGSTCCKHKSKTDLPPSLKCRGCCLDSCGSVCVVPSVCGPTYCNDPPCCTPSCTSCPRGKCSCKLTCAPSKCLLGCTANYGLKMTVKRKCIPEPAPIEIIPRSSCVLQKPFAARSCHHLPHCIPPSSCFPYLMPCFWPARADAPCSQPDRCFHNPPCKPPRDHRPPIHRCPPGECQPQMCTNDLCFGIRHGTFTGSSYGTKPYAQGSQNTKSNDPKQNIKLKGSNHNINPKDPSLENSNHNIKSKGPSTASNHNIKAKSPSYHSDSSTSKGPMKKH